MVDEVPTRNREPGTHPKGPEIPPASTSWSIHPAGKFSTNRSVPNHLVERVDALLAARKPLARRHPGEEE
jgi:hypothetical protein